MNSASSNVYGNAEWHAEKKDEAHVSLIGVFKVVREECEWRVDADEYHAGLYCASDKAGIRGQSRKSYQYGPATLPHNVARMAVDTLTAKIAQHRPLPEVLTQRGSWKNQKRARKMTQFVEGEFYRQRIFEKQSPRIVRDAGVFGRGVLKIWVEADRICTERVHPWELFVDEWDAKHADPRNMYHCRSIDKGVALALFARSESGGVRTKIRDAIRTAGRFDIGSSYEAEVTSTVDRVDVLEAWHLPSFPGANDGRHIICVQGATLLDEAWDYDYFPFAILGYNDPLEGYWAHGLVEQVEGHQYEINLSSEKASEQFRMSGKLVVSYDGSGVHDQEFRNGISILHCKPGMRPDVFDMDFVNEHVRQRPRELVQDALNETGLSQMSVQSQRPPGITAAIALQTLDDIETERFIIFGRAYETWCLEVGRRFIDCAKKIAEKYGDLAVSVPMKGGMLKLSWNDVYVDGVEIRVFPTSLLPQQLPARLDRLKDLWNTGLIDRGTFLRHLDAPDMQAELDLETADQLLIDEVLECMLDANEDEDEAEVYRPPSAYYNLQWAGRRAQQKLNRADLDGAPEFNKELLRRYLKDVDVELAKLGQRPGQAANANLAPAPLAPNGMAPAGPAPMPGAPAAAA